MASIFDSNELNLRFASFLKSSILSPRIDFRLSNLSTTSSLNSPNSSLVTNSFCIGENVMFVDMHIWNYSDNHTLTSKKIYVLNSEKNLCSDAIKFIKSNKVHKLTSAEKCFVIWNRGDVKLERGATSLLISARSHLAVTTVGLPSIPVRFCHEFCLESHSLLRWWVFFPANDR